MKRRANSKRTKLRRKAKTGTLSYWKQKFWTVFSEYIRKRDNFTCFTCGKKGEGKGMHAGHFIPKAAGGLSLYFDERGVNAQCYYCNINLGGNGAEYYRKMVEKYGQEVVDELFHIKDTGYQKFTIQDYKDLIEEYKEKIKCLDTSKEDK